ncbi:hypothetical protein FACS1894188_09420 [Clostridia bacterium]|nr:hypothetical protein FACS1894188_09420 [Clostridia bacterium]
MGTGAIFSIIGICVLLLLIFSAQLGFALKFAVRAAVGLIALFLGNLISAPLFGVSVGINIFTGAVVGALGVPGFILLYILGYFL